MGLFEMNFYVTRDKNRLYHVQNMVMGHYGQHHVHTKKSFNDWKRDVVTSNIIYHEDTICDCGLKAGKTIDGDPNDYKMLLKTAKKEGKYLVVPFTDIKMKHLGYFKNGIVDGDRESVLLEI